MKRPRVFEPSVRSLLFTSVLAGLALSFVLYTLTVSAESSPEVAQTKPPAGAELAKPAEQQVMNAQAQEATAEPVVPDLDPQTVAAEVNGKQIKVADITNEIQKQPNTAMMMNMIKTPEMAKKVRVSVLNNMINRQLLISEAKASKITTDEVQLGQSITQIETRNGGADKFKEKLTQMGMSYDQFKSEVADEMSISNYLKTVVVNGASVSPEEVRKAFDAKPDTYATKAAVHVRHILIKTEQGETAEQKKSALDKINAIYTDVTKPGADFGAIAKEKSQCPSAPQGGDLGFVEPGQTVEPFEKAAFALKAGEISKPVESQFGYHIIKMEEKRDAGAANFDTVKAQIEQQLLQQKQSQMVQDKLASLRTTAKVKINI